MLEIGERIIGPGQPTFIAAEIGINHNGDLDLAKAMIVAAAKAGADGVKFQNYRTEDFIADRSLTYTYVSQGDTVVESQYDMFKRYEMPREWLPELKRCGDANGVVFFSTPTSEQGIQDLLDVGVTVFKNGSDYLGHLPLIESFARTGLPTLLSTGMAEASEIDAAVAAYREAGGEGLLLLHCTSSYPTPLEDANLDRMIALENRYDCPVGFSDHTEGHAAAEVAAAMGAVFIEKHFTTDQNLSGPDHRFSATPEELASLMDRIRLVEQLKGTGAITHGPSEAANRVQFRLSCRASRAMTAGTVLSSDDIAISRPGDGMSPTHFDELVGMQLVRDLQPGDAIEENCVERRS